MLCAKAGPAIAIAAADMSNDFFMDPVPLLGFVAEPCWKSRRRSAGRSG
jgi:hypothetical protein